MRFVFAFWLALVGSVQAAGLDERLLLASEPDRLAAVRIDDLRALLHKLDRFLGPFSVEAAPMFSLLAPGVFRSRASDRLDLAWPVAFVLALPPMSAPSLAYSTGASDPEAFLSGLGSPLDSGSGLRAYRSSEGLDLYAFSEGNELLVSERPELASLARASSPLAARPPRPASDLELELWPARFLARAADRWQAFEDDFHAQLEGLYGQPGISTKEMRSFYDMIFLIFESLARQTERLTLGLTLDGGDLVLEFGLQPVAGSALQRFLLAQSEVRETPLPYVPKDAVGALGLSFQSTPELVDALLAFEDPLGLRPPDDAAPEAREADLPPPLLPTIVPTPTVQEQRERLRPLYTEFYSKLGPSVGIVLLPVLPDKKGVRTITTFGLKEPAQFLDRLRSMITATLPDLQASYRQLGWAYDLWLARSPIPGMPPDTYQLEMRYAGLSPEQKSVFDALYGGPEMRVFLNFAGEVGIAVTGPDGAELLGETLRRVNSRPPAAPGSNRVLAGFLDVQEYLRLTLETMPEAQVLRAKTAVEAYLRTPQKLFVEASVLEGGLRLRIRYPLEATLTAYRETIVLRKLR